MAELLKILYVEDEADIREIAKLALEQIGGFEVALCSSGEEALHKAAAYKPDMILLDVMMPGMDGPTTLQHLRTQKALADVPVAFLTAKVQPQEIQAFREMGALDVITKPFDPMTLADQVRRVWQQGSALSS